MSPQVGTVVAQYGPGLGQVMGKASLPDTLATSMQEKQGNEEETTEEKGPWKEKKEVLIGFWMVL